ncbi:hypothetical protein BKA62DRAFT_167202 [Auriculariales sp. MPI-PUGE-AT-0066]|nr:hypothetical protein BKA62DRAFT_167202 [Auriculariales sp. MPI-PUGE-AT-0066]
MPFDLKLDIENVEEGADLNLSNIVLPHHQRMASVYGTVQDPLSFQTFLSLFTSLPSLRRIGLTSRMTDAELVREEPLLLPMLSSLALYGRLTCGENFLFLCPATSSVTSMFNNSGHILRLLRACPSAAKWVLQIGSRQAVAADEDMDEVHNLLSAAQIQSLEIGRAYRVDVEPCLKMFAPAMIARFDIACANTEGIYGSDLERHLLQNNEQATFSHLECVLFYENRDQAKISLESNGGSRRRSVTLIVGEDDDGAFRACLRLVARVLATGPVTSARITSSFWPSIFQQSTDQYEILATSIIVEFDGDDVDDWMSLCAAAEPTRFVRLEHLTLRAASGKPSLKASDPFVVNFSRVFGVDRMLHKLVIEGISLTGDVDCLVGKVAVEVELATSAQS